AEAAGAARPHVDDAVDTGVERGIGRTETPHRVGRHRMDPAVRRIDAEPGAASLRDVERIAKLRRPDARGPREHLLAAFFEEPRELGALHVLHAPAHELLGPLERRALLVLVRIGALQVWITPRRARCDVTSCLLRSVC